MIDTKIYLVVGMFPVTGPGGSHTGRKELLVSHGVGNVSLTNICLPCEHPDTFSPLRDAEGLYIPA